MKWFSFALSLLPGILNAVVAVESALKGQPGQTKKGVILSAIGAAAQAGEQIPEQHVQLVSNLVDGVVKIFNDSGVFTHGTTPAS